MSYLTCTSTCQHITPLLSDCTRTELTNRIPSCLGIPFRLSEPDSSCLSPDRDPSQSPRPHHLTRRLVPLR